MMAVPMLVGRLGLWMAVLGISLGSAFSMSAESDAAWVVGCGVGDGWRLLELQRRMARMLLPVPLLFAIGVVLLVTGIYDFVTNRTVLGRHIYAVGGNPEAAELSGISVKKIIFTVFGSMGMLSALSGILFASRLQSATTTAGSPAT